MKHSLEEKIMHQLRITHNLIRRGVHAHGHGNEKADRMQMRAHHPLLAFLAQKDGQTQRELCEQLDMRPSSLSELLDKLEQSNLIQRRVNSEDKRVSNIFLTEEGKERISEIMKKRHEHIENNFTALDDNEKQTLHDLLAKLNLSLADMQKDTFTGIAHHEHGPRHPHREHFCRFGHGHRHSHEEC